MSDDQNSPESTTEINIEEQIINLEASLGKVKERYQQIKVDSVKKEELTKRKVEINEQLKNNNLPDSLKSELNYIEKELTEIEMRLESELFNWTSLLEPFWQAVRFGGIGIVIGWFLKHYSG